MFSRLRKQKDNCSITINELLEKDSSKLIATTIINGFPAEFRDKGTDSIRAGYYSFYKNGDLKAYSFFATTQAYTYHEEYDVIGGLTRIEGKPLVNYNVELISKDSVFFQLYFFALNKKYENLNISANNVKMFNLSLTDDTLYSNMKVVSFGLNVKGIENIKVYLDVKYINACTQKKETLKDTIALKYTP